MLTETAKPSRKPRKPSNKKLIPAVVEGDSNDLKMVNGAIVTEDGSTIDSLSESELNASSPEGGSEIDMLAALLDQAAIDDTAAAVSAAPTNVKKVEAGKRKSASTPPVESSSQTSASSNVAAPRAGVSAKASEKIAFRLGGQANSILILESSDSELSESDLKTYQDDLLKSFDATSQIKVREKISQLFGYLANPNSKLNEVLKRAFTTLIADGQLTSGEEGNLFASLLAKPYSVGTARAQSGQIFSLFPQLKIVNKTSSGVYTVNPNSVILSTMKQRLSL